MLVATAASPQSIHFDRKPAAHQELTAVQTAHPYSPRDIRKVAQEPAAPWKG
jgi:hypothetical protein